MQAPWLWPRIEGTKSLYQLDATVDEGAAERPEVQEGQAGHSGQSGLATGTEKRRNEQSEERQSQTLKCVWGEISGEGVREVPPDNTHYERLRQQVLLGGEEGSGGKEEGEGSPAKVMGRGEDRGHRGGAVPEQ